MRIILGSRSEGRKKILEQILGHNNIEVMPADIDEKQFKSEDPIMLTWILAMAKAHVLIPRISGPPALLITSDQVVVCNGKIREKPENFVEAVEFLSSYSHFSADTVTSVVVAHTRTGHKVDGTDIAKILFRFIPPTVITKYILTGDSYEQAGGFDHEHPLLKPYVKWIEGEPESITGLPRKLTESLIRQVS